MHRRLFLAVAASTMSLAFVADAASRRTVAVDGFSGSELTGGAATADSLSAILTDLLIQDGRFAVVENLQGGAQSTMRPTALVRGAVVKFNAAASGGGLSVGGLPFGTGAGAKTHKVTVVVSLRFIDTATGEVVAIASAEGAANAQDADANLQRRNGSSLGGSASHSGSVGQAIEDAVRKALSKVALPQA